ncbi:MAG: ABC transporter substrate-binding protein, partial [Flavobacteriales bacterium]|nr:ABC transporter substrate-binding protein [Flavobacteriales bacterium]
MKKLFCIVAFLLTLNLFSQNFESQWSGYFSFTNIVDVSEGDDRLIAASENAVFIYDFITREIETITTIQGLSGEKISKIHYSKDYDLIIIGYENGLIEIINEDKEVLKVVDILNKPTIPPNQKRINHFNEFNGLVYISTDFGISLYDLVGLEFGDTYIIGDFGTQSKIFKTAVFEDYIYAAMNNKVKRALVNNTNLIDFSQWSDIFNFGSFGVQAFGNNLYMIDQLNNLNRFNGTIFQQVASFPQTNRNIFSTSNFLTVTSNNQSTVFDVNLNVVATVASVADYEYTLSNTLAYNNKVYLGTKEHGILEVPFGSTQAEQILPDGPILNNPFALDTSAGQLWVVFGEVNIFFNPFPLNRRGISLLENEIWTNIPFGEVLGAKSIVHVKINPNKPEEVYASSMHDGLLKINQKVPSILYNQTNSSLEFANLEPGDVSLRIFGSDFDRQGNLWFVQSGPDDAIKRLTPSGQIQGFDITEIIPNPKQELGLNKLKVSREGNVFIASSSNGLLGFNPATNSLKKIGRDLGDGNLPSPNIRSLAFDNRNQLWIGTLSGLRVLFNTSGFFEPEANVDTQPIIILDDGVPQELLFQQSITDIEVDGSNNKWVATATSGVFYFSPNGQETLLRFTKDNSPLPSNNVLDIAIDPRSGVVYFATANGLVSYNGSATAPSDNLQAVRAFPNPVRPGFNGNVTIDGLMARSNVKITDLNGNL